MEIQVYLQAEGIFEACLRVIRKQSTSAFARTEARQHSRVIVVAFWGGEYAINWREHHPNKAQNYCCLNNSAIILGLRCVYEYYGESTIPGHP